MNRNIRKNSTADGDKGLVKNETPDEEIKVRNYCYFIYKNIR